MEYEEIKLLKQSEKSTVHLVHKKGEEQVFIRKVLKGQHHIYLTLQSCRHPYLPKLYEVIIADDSTTVIEEYIEGQSLGNAELSEKQLLSAVKELCSVLEFLHGKDIIHRDVKPSNIILAKDGHIRLIDFDASRMPKDDLEQDTRLLGTWGYAPPEQYGFAQTDARADIYAFGITMKQLLGDKAQKPCYRRIIQKCINLDPDKRFQSAKQVKRAFSYRKRGVLYSFMAVILLAFLGIMIVHQSALRKNLQTESDELVLLPAPDNPHWNGETGIAIWGNVPESGVGGEVKYNYRVYRRDTPTPPDPDEDMWDWESGMRGNGGIDEASSTYIVNMVSGLQENGFYYFAVSAAGDGIHYSDSPYVISDAFEYTGESAPPLPTPTGLQWKMLEANFGRIYFATWSNLDDYSDDDSFNVSVYDKDGNYVMNNIWTKEDVISRGFGGIMVEQEYLADLDGAYRFTVQAYTSRPNEYKSSFMPYPIPEEYFSPWYYRYNVPAGSDS